MELTGSDALRDFPFYAARLDSRGIPEPWSLDDLEDFAAASDDAFGGRVRAGSKPAVALQIEATSEPPVWTALAPRELAAWARIVSRAWSRLGLAAGDAIAFFDYGSNPCVLLSSSIYVPHLRRGAATGLGAHTICNDGVASMTARMLVILETVRPAALVLRRDLVTPLLDAMAGRERELGASVRWAAVSEVDGAPEARETERVRAALGVPVRRLLRADAAFLFAADCEACGLFHVDARYRVEALAAGGVAVSARFVAGCPAVRYRLDRAALAPAGCLREPRAKRVAWE